MLVGYTDAHASLFVSTDRSKAPGKLRWSIDVDPYDARSPQSANQTCIIGVHE